MKFFNNNNLISIGLMIIVILLWLSYPTIPIFFPVFGNCLQVVWIFMLHFGVSFNSSSNDKTSINFYKDYHQPTKPDIKQIRKNKLDKLWNN